MKKIKITKEQAMMLESLSSKKKVMKITEEQFNRIKELVDLNNEAVSPMTKQFTRALPDNESRNNFIKNVKGETKIKGIMESNEELWSEFINELYGLTESGSNQYEKLIGLMELNGYLENRKIKKSKFNDDKDLAKDVILSGVYRLKETGSPYQAIEEMEKSYEDIVKSFRDQLSQKSSKEFSQDDINTKLSDIRQKELERRKKESGEISEDVDNSGTIVGLDILNHFPFNQLPDTRKDADWARGVAGWGKVYLPSIDSNGLTQIVAKDDFTYREVQGPKMVHKFDGYIQNFKDKFGEEPIFKINPEGSWYDKVTVVNPKYLESKEIYDRGMQAWIDMDKSAGRSGGLDEMTGAESSGAFVGKMNQKPEFESNVPEEINGLSNLKKKDLDEALKLQHNKTKNELVVISDLEGKAASQETFKNKALLRQNGFRWDGQFWTISADQLESAKKTLSLVNKVEYIINSLEELEEVIDYSGGDSDLKLKLETHINDLANATDEAALSAEIRRYLTFFAKFHNYSFYNRMLIFIQNPKATRVASYKKWQEKHRQVNKGAKAIKILAPIIPNKPKSDDLSPEDEEMVDSFGTKTQTPTRFRAVNVFDISDTTATNPEGEVPDAPQWWADNEPSETADKLYQAAKEVAETMGINVTQSDSKSGEKGYSAGDHINLSSDVSGVGRLSTMIHEIAHELMHWKKSSIYYIDNGQGSSARALAELQAESVSYVVLKHYDLPVKQHPTYLALWKANKELIQKNMEIISNVSQFIIKRLDAEISENDENKNTVDEATTTISTGNSQYATPGFASSEFFGNKGKSGKAPVNKGVTHKKTMLPGGKFVSENELAYPDGSFIEFDDCTKLNNNKEAQSGGCSVGAVDNVVKFKKKITESSKKTICNISTSSDVTEIAKLLDEVEIPDEHSDEISGLIKDAMYSQTKLGSDLDIINTTLRKIQNILCIPK